MKTLPACPTCDGPTEEHCDPTDERQCSEACDLVSCRACNAFGTITLTRWVVRT